MSLPALEVFLADEAFSALDRCFARQVVHWAKPESMLVGHAAALASWLLQRHHLCLPLEQSLDSIMAGPARAAPWPSVTEWRDDLLRSGVVATGEQEFLPLVLSPTNKLYLHRYAEYEQHLAAHLLARLADDRLRVIVGGPGTGKTHTILHTLLGRIRDAPESRIALAAPTGKAAQRMEESILRGLAAMDLDAATRERVPAHASTLHRLLGSRSDSAFFRHDARNPLPLDLLVIDEASMVDLPLMAKLCAALAPQTTLMLVGDPHQLASVEVGAVLADVVAAAGSNPALGGALTTLRKQYRYGPESGIGRLAAAIREGDHAGALQILADDQYPDVRLRALPGAAVLGEALQRSAAFLSLRSAFADKAAAPRLAAHGRSRILCPLRRGPWGVDNLNAVAERLLQAAGQIDAGRMWYDGRPVLVLRNDYDLGLFNGDTGVVCTDPGNGEPQVVFFDDRGAPRALSPARLPPTQTNFAMTVHRSQGSEFDHVLLVLPESDSTLLSRELLYTAASRARRDVEIWADAATIRRACERPARRASGLAERLVPQTSGPAHAG